MKKTIAIVTIVLMTSLLFVMNRGINDNRKQGDASIPTTENLTSTEAQVGSNGVTAPPSLYSPTPHVKSSADTNTLEIDGDSEALISTIPKGIVPPGKKPFETLALKEEAAVVAEHPEWPASEIDWEKAKHKGGWKYIGTSKMSKEDYEKFGERIHD